MDRALKEVWRVLRPGGILFLVETVEDNPIIRWGRRLYPSWLGDEINAPFYFNGLQSTVEQSGFRVQEAGQYSILFWLWEVMPDQLPAMERLTPAMVSVEKTLRKAWPDQSAHCFVIAERLDSEEQQPA